MADEPWMSDPVVRQRGAAQTPRYETISSSYTNETPEQLRAQGYEQDETGTWFRVVGQVQERPQAEAAQPWEADPVATESQLRAATDADARAANTPGALRALTQGATLGFSDEIDALGAGLETRILNLGRRLQGEEIPYTAQEAEAAVRLAERRSQEDFGANRPLLNAALQFAGGLGTGGAAIGTGLRGALATGAAYGAGYGGGTAEGGFAERLPGAVTGGVVGGVTGGAVGAAAPYAQRLIGSVGNSFRNAIGRGATPEQRAALRLAGTMDSDAVQTEIARRQALGINSTAADVMGGASERLIRTAAGPAGPGADAAVANLKRQQANLKPDLISTTRALSEDPRSAMAVREGLDAQRSTLATEQYAPAYETQVPITPEILSALSDEPGRAALRRARQAAIARRNSQQVAEIDNLLNGDFSAPAPTGRSLTAAIKIGDEIYTGQTHIDALAKVPEKLRRRFGMDADNRGYVTDRGGFLNRIRAQRYASQHGLFRDDAPSWVETAPELASEYLRPATTTQPTVSAGTLDRVRIALSNRAEALGRNTTGARDIAGGLRGRAGDINAALESVPQLQPARDTYRNLSGAIDAVDNAPAVFTTDPQDFAAMVANYTPEQRQAAIVGVRQEIMDTLGGQKAAGTGTLDRVSQSDYGRQNLTALLGPDEAQRYLDIIATRVGDVQRAARISPNTNSQTFGRGIDEETFNTANMVGAGLDVVQGARGNPLAIARTIDRIRARATMSPEERQAIVELGLGPVDNIERIIRLADEARNAGRPPPREVRAWVVNAQNTLGAQNPVAIELQRLLLPARVSAEEEGQ